MSNYNKKTILLILDGYGIGPKDEFNAIDNAKTPNIDKLIREYPNATLLAHGKSVGLPEDQFGTSEVNHMTIGAGRIIWQDLPKISNQIDNGQFFTNPALVNALAHVKANSSKLHLVGIYSDGGVHSIIEHVNAIFELANKHEFTQKICLHIFTDGRDTPPKSAEKYMSLLTAQIAANPNLNIELCTYQGRILLDRDRDWERTEKSYNLIANAQGTQFSDWQAVVNFEYNQGRTDEHFDTYKFSHNGKFASGDAVIFFHYRTDRLYQLVKRTIDEQQLKDFYICTFTVVSHDFNSVHVAFPRSNIDGTLAQAISQANKTQLHITETEKFAHLTYFLNGEKEKELPGETWQMFESNRQVKPNYQVEPSMRNFEIMQSIISAINTNKYDFIVANLTTADMVGHTGDYNAAVISAQAVDYAVGKIYEAVKEKLADYALIVTADHGNSEQMWDYENNQPHTQHTLNPVPFILVSDINCRLDRAESLEDVAPTVLDLMGVQKPIQMTGKTLIINSQK